MVRKIKVRKIYLVLRMRNAANMVTLQSFKGIAPLYGCFLALVRKCLGKRLIAHEIGKIVGVT